MSKLMPLIRRAPKRFSAAIAMVAVAIIVPAAVFAWGPDRPLYTMNNPADHITFNSMTDNPNVGDERDFVVVKDAANTASGGWQNNVTVEPGKEYLVRVYVHNNAATSLNLTATNTRVSATVPTTTAKSVPLSGFVTADNASPNKIWDDVTFNSSSDFNLVYVPGSAVIYNNGYAKNGAALPDSIVTSTGALVGYNGPDGKVPGCFQYANYVYFKVKPQFAPTNKFEMSKSVSKHNENKWVESYAAKPGETVDFLIQYKNVGQTRHENVTFRDTLPTGLTYVKDSTMLVNQNNPSGVITSNNLTNGVGINVGSYTTNANALVRFSAKVADNDKLPVCGPNKLVNTAKVTANGGSISDTAEVTVFRECEPGKITVCEIATKKLITIKENQFDASKHTKDLSKCAETTKINVCEIATNKIISIEESQFDASKHTKDLTKCELPQTGTTENIVAITGLGALIASIAYYVASRRALGL